MAEAKEEQQLSWIQRVEAMESAIELLLETLADLSDKELERFKRVLQGQTPFYRHYSDIHLKTADRQDMVFLMVQTNGQKSLEETKTILEKMDRTDLVQKLSHSGSGPKKKPSVDEQQSAALIHKVATMAAVRELLLETLGTLSDKEVCTFRWLLQFTFFQRSLPRIRKLQWIYSIDELVDLMMEMCGQQSVEVTKEIFMNMNRTDLVQRLPEISSGHKEKHPVDEHWPALIQKVETMVSMTELLLETLTGLSDGELERFWEVLQSQTDIHRHVLDSPLKRGRTGMQDTVFLMVQFYGQQSVEKTKEFLKKMNRTDLVQKLRDTSSGLKKKHSDELQSALIQKVATMAAVKQLLFETLNELSSMSFKKFLELVTSQKNPDYLIFWKHTADRAEIVDQMVERYGLQSMELTREVLKKMNRTDLMRRLSKPSSELKEKHSDEHQSALSERAAVKHILETLKDLGHKEIEKIKWLLQFTYFQKSLPHNNWGLQNAYSANNLVDVMYETCGQQSVEVIKEVFMDMNRRDLVKSLSEISSRLKEKYQAELLQKRAVKENILETLHDLSKQELEEFKWYLHVTGLKKGLPNIPRQHTETAGRFKMVDLVVETYDQQSVEVTREVLKMMRRQDLVERLSHSNSGPKKGPSRSFELEAGGGTVQVSSDWTKLEPEVSSTDADEAPTYSLQSEAGNFECSVSSLRWVCKEKVSFTYQFCSWAEHMERMESIEYMPAGSLIDITVISGKLDEVYLSHWICIEDNPEILDKFAVLHIDDCGDEVEKVSEVTSSHVKLSEPVFSPRGVLMKVGFPVKVNCNVLIYKTNTAFLTLHVYLIPDDRGLQQTMDQTQLSYGYKVIRKPHPQKPLKMRDCFILTADLDVAEIYPKEALMLRYQGRSTNFFEVYIKNADENFELKLSKENEQQPVWTCAIRTDEYQSTGHTQGEHFVDKHHCDLIDRVSNVKPILDSLLRDGVIQQEDYDKMCGTPTSQEKMRILLIGPLRAAGHVGKDIFYKILEEKEKYLVADLRRKES